VVGRFFRDAFGKLTRNLSFNASSKAARDVPSVAEYRRCAARSLKVAEAFSDPMEKARLLLMAQTFLELADRLEQRAKRPPWLPADAQRK